MVKTIYIFLKIPNKVLILISTTVKNNIDIRKAFVEAHGEENWDLYAWRIACEAVKVKYEYCPEFRKYVDDNRGKLFVENSFWKKIPKAGVLKVTDENSPYFGKYIGCNFTGVAIQRCVE